MEDKLWAKMSHNSIDLKQSHNSNHGKKDALTITTGFTNKSY